MNMIPSVKPSLAEEEFFARQEFERLKKIHEARSSQIKSEEKKRRQEMCFMHCPKCGSDLLEVTLQNIKIDKCPECNGIWFDQGELDLLLKGESGLLGKIAAIFK